MGDLLLKKGKQQMSESYLLLKQIQDYGIEFLFPENINIGIIRNKDFPPQIHG